MKYLTKKILTNLFIVCFVMFGFIFFVGCSGNDPEQKTVTDDGSLNHEAYCDIKTGYTIDDFNSALGTQTDFSSFDGFRFTYLYVGKDGEDNITNKINGISTSEGMNFLVEKRKNGAVTESELITYRFSGVYVRVNNTTQENEDGELEAKSKTYKKTSETKFVILKNYLSDLGFSKIYYEPKSVLDLRINKQVTVLKHETNFALTIKTEENTFDTIFVNFNENGNLSAIRYQDQLGQEQIILSGFNGEIEFPNLDDYVQSN